MCKDVEQGGRGLFNVLSRLCSGETESGKGEQLRLDVALSRVNALPLREAAHFVMFKLLQLLINSKRVVTGRGFPTPYISVPRKNTSVEGENDGVSEQPYRNCFEQ